VCKLRRAAASDGFTPVGVLRLQGCAHSPPPAAVAPRALQIVSSALLSYQRGRSAGAMGCNLGVRQRALALVLLSLLAHSAYSLHLTREQNAAELAASAEAPEAAFWSWAWANDRPYATRLRSLLAKPPPGLLGSRSAHVTEPHVLVEQLVASSHRAAGASQAAWAPLVAAYVERRVVWQDNLRYAQLYNEAQGPQSQHWVGHSG
jgi:hypothetical protein